MHPNKGYWNKSDKSRCRIIIPCQIPVCKLIGRFQVHKIKVGLLPLAEIGGNIAIIPCDIAAFTLSVKCNWPSR